MAALALAMLGGCSGNADLAANNTMAGPGDYAEANAAATDMTTDDALIVGGSGPDGNEAGNGSADALIVGGSGPDGNEAGNVTIGPAIRPMARSAPGPGENETGTRPISPRIRPLARAAPGSGGDETGNVSAAEPVAAGAGGTVYCDLIQDNIPAAECEHYRQVWARLETGEGALDAPPAMTRGVAQIVSFALTRASAPVRAGEMLDSAPEKTAAVRVGRRMAARLEGESFTIDPAGLVERDLFAGGAGRWDWTVTPTRGGPQRLRLGVYVIVRSPDGASRENLIRTLSHDINVAVAKGDQRKDAIRESKSWLDLANEWLLALAALVGGGLLAVWLAIRKFRAPKGGKEE
jgi:hypothetical protein